jgi:hypothetical protein
MNLLDALNQVGVPWKPHRSRFDDGEVYICCPFCTERHESPDTRFRLSVNYKTSMGHCYNCGWASKDALRSLSYMLRIGELAPAENPGVSQRRPEKVELPEEYIELADVQDANDPLWFMKEYLLKRGVTQKQIEKKKIGCCIGGRYAYSIILPVYYGETGLCGWISRDVTGKRSGKDGKPLRYLNSEGTKVAYNVPYPLPKNCTVVITEGAFKALAVERCLNPKSSWVSVSVQGNTVSDLQVNQFAGAKELVFFPDPGREGRVQFINAAESNQPLFERVTIAYPLPSYQADELSKEKVIDHLRQRKTYSHGLGMQLKSKEILGGGQ